MAAACVSRWAQPPEVGQAARGMAELAALLGAGEESAVTAFQGLARAHAPAARDLLAIARDERRHERLVLAIRSDLPDAAADAGFRRAQRRFFLEVATGDVGERFARIFALDSAVCLILSAVRRRPAARRFAASLAEIHRDEARHAALARAWARRLGDSGRNAGLFADTRAALIDLLERRAEALTATGVAPEALFDALRRPMAG